MSLALEGRFLTTGPPEKSRFNGFAIEMELKCVLRFGRMKGLEIYTLLHF